MYKEFYHKKIIKRASGLISRARFFAARHVRAETGRWGVTVMGLVLLTAVAGQWTGATPSNNPSKPVLAGQKKAPQNAVVQNMATDREFPLVILVAAEGLTVDDINSADTPFLSSLAETAAVGLMNPKTASGYSRENAYITLAAGRPALAGPDGGIAMAADVEVGGVTAGRLYQARTGRQAKGIVFLSLPSAIEANRRHKTYATPGLLGETLSRNGLKTAVVGNADIPGEYNRAAATMVMDRWGGIEYGDVSRSLLLNSEPLLWRSDFEALFQRAMDFAGANLLLVETGDLTRLELLKEEMLEPVWQQERRAALKRIDAFARRLHQTPQLQQALFVFFSPAPSRSAQGAKNFFTPLIIDRAGLSGKLTSGTTRRPGVVTNTDLTASIYHWLGVDAPKGITGQPIEAITAQQPLAQLAAFNRQAAFIYRVRPTLVKGYVLVQIIVIALAMLGLFTKRRHVKLLQPVLIGLTAVPLALLLVGWLPVSASFAAYVTAVLLLTALLVAAALVWARNPLLDPFIYVCLLTATAITADLLSGAPLMKQSTLGYDAMAGARYYGIGNEFMGVLVGSSVIGIASLYQRMVLPRPRRRPAANKLHQAPSPADKWINFTPAQGLVKASVGFNLIQLLPAGAVLLFLVIIVGAPQLGANFGGTLASLVAYVFLLLSLWGGNINYRNSTGTAAVMSLIVAAFIFYDVQRPVAVQSHLGRLAGSVFDGGPQVLLQVVYRKLAMNAKLIKWTIWSRVFLVMLAALAVLSVKPVGIFRYISRQYPYFHRGLLAVTVGSGAALIFNDSGIVAAATMMIFATAPLVYIAIARQHSIK